ncbi:hypothetical protein QJS04_geneDACA014531 [Acorus gramineus]|uniref:Uncharacterized protein n=1 Tax=Acorus gramineus TaxID=55184 RepID=A0AAV9AQ06_ACOGR|nr:hypothetical protein QJS04_geneDACA014531 [Acorus gramineus]
MGGMSQIHGLRFIGEYDLGFTGEYGLKFKGGEYSLEFMVEYVLDFWAVYVCLGFMDMFRIHERVSRIHRGSVGCMVSDSWESNSRIYGGVCLRFVGVVCLRFMGGMTRIHGGVCPRFMVEIHRGYVFYS